MTPAHRLRALSRAMDAALADNMFSRSPQHERCHVRGWQMALADLADALDPPPHKWVVPVTGRDMISREYGR